MMINPEAGRHDGSTQLIHIHVERMWYAFLQAMMQCGWLPLRQIGNNGFHRTQDVCKVLANTGSTEF
jgi:hypothetical protein